VKRSLSLDDISLSVRRNGRLMTWWLRAHLSSVSTWAPLQRNDNQYRIRIFPGTCSLIVSLTVIDNLYSPKNTVAAMNKQKQYIGLYTYFNIAWALTTVHYHRLSETVKEITVPVLLFIFCVHMCLYWLLLLWVNCIVVVITASDCGSKSTFISTKLILYLQSPLYETF